MMANMSEKPNVMAEGDTSSRGLPTHRRSTRIEVCKTVPDSTR